jgi:hypothetical protein
MEIRVEIAITHKCTDKTIEIGQQHICKECLKIEPWSRPNFVAGTVSILVTGAEQELIRDNENCHDIVWYSE